MEKLKFGVVGAGHIATAAHLPAYKSAKNAELVAICDIDIDCAKQQAEKFGVKNVYGSVEEMLADCDIDAVDICCWNNGHAPVAIAAANAKKHVLCEKPLTVSNEAAKSIYDAVKKNDVNFMLAVPNRFGHANMLMRELYDAGEFGDIYYAKTTNIRRRGTPTGWFTDKKTSGGGPIIDIGIHRIDAAWYIMGTPKPISVSAAVSYAFGDYQTKDCPRWEGKPCPDNKFDCEDSGAGVIRFENGAIMVFEASWALNAQPYGNTLLCGTKAGCTLDPPVIFGETNGYLSQKSLDTLDNDRILGEIEHFADCVINNKPNKYPIEQALLMQKILNGIYESAEKGKEVLL